MLRKELILNVSFINPFEYIFSETKTETKEKDGFKGEYLKKKIIFRIKSRICNMFPVPYDDKNCLNNVLNVRQNEKKINQ